MWEVATAMVRNADDVNSFLAGGYEPFAVSTDAWGERIWLKREVENVVQKEEGRGTKKGRGKTTPSSTTS